MRKRWKIKGEVLRPYYIDIWYTNTVVIYIRAFTQAGAERKGLRKLRRRYKTDEVKVIRVRQLNSER